MSGREFAEPTLVPKSPGGARLGSEGAAIGRQRRLALLLYLVADAGEDHIVVGIGGERLPIGAPLGERVRELGLRRRRNFSRHAGLVFGDEIVAGRNSD